MANLWVEYDFLVIDLIENLDELLKIAFTEGISQKYCGLLDEYIFYFGFSIL